MSKALPTLTHFSLAKLIEIDKLKYIISQNVDGLHRRSGVHAGKILELHGNTNIERCPLCKKEYLRDFRVRTSIDPFQHETGRICEDGHCEGKLVDSIVNFGEKII